MNHPLPIGTRLIVKAHPEWGPWYIEEWSPKDRNGNGNWYNIRGRAGLKAEFPENIDRYYQEAP